MKNHHISLYLLTALLLVGCNVVKSPVPFGLTPIRISTNSLENIVWSAEQYDDLKIRVVDPASGMLEIAMNESTDPNNPKWRTKAAYLMAGAKYQYVSIPYDDDETGTNGFLFVCIDNAPTKVIVWVPDRMKFRKHILNGTIDGQVIKEDVHLAKPTKEFFDYIESGDNGVFFEWQNPMIIKKTSRTEPSAGPYGSPAAGSPSGQP